MKVQKTATESVYTVITRDYNPTKVAPPYLGNYIRSTPSVYYDMMLSSALP